jgi:lipoprotein LprG
MFRSSRTTRALAIAVGTGTLAVALSACTTASKASTANLPPAADLITASQTAMSGVQTVHFSIGVKGTLPGVPISAAQGDLTKTGDAKGTATVSVLGTNVETEFIIVDKTIYLKGATGGYTPEPLSAAAAFFDPSGILDPDRGIVKLLGTAQNPTTKALESVNGSDAYKIGITPDPAAVAAIVPGAGAGTTGDIWIDKTTHRVVKGVFTVPGTGGAQGATVTVEFSNFDAPVTVSAP